MINSILPKQLWIEVTSDCNNSCSYCPFHSGNPKNDFWEFRKKGYMVFSDFKKLVDSVVSISGYDPVVSFIGMGEPLLHKDIFRMIHYANSNGLETMLSSNCILLDDSFVDRVFSSGLKSFIFNVVSFDKKIFSDITGGKDYFKTFINWYNLISRNKGLGFPVKVSATVTIVPMVHTDLDLFVTSYVLKNLGLDHFGVGYFCPVGWLGYLFKKPVGLVRVIPCDISCSGCVLWDGSVVACPFDYRKNMVFGNVFHDSFLDVFTGDRCKLFHSLVRSLDYDRLVDLGLSCNTCNWKYNDFDLISNRSMGIGGSYSGYVGTSKKWFLKNPHLD